MPSVTLFCRDCGKTARRVLTLEAGSRGVHETSSEPALCPDGHGLMAREDGLPQENWALWSDTAGFYRPKITHTDVVQALKDLHRWVLSHKNARIICADRNGYFAYNAFTEAPSPEEVLHVTLDPKVAQESFQAMPEGKLKHNLRLAFKRPDGRRFLASLLSTSNGWHQLVGSQWDEARFEELMAK